LNAIPASLEGLYYTVAIFFAFQDVGADPTTSSCLAPVLHESTESRISETKKFSPKFLKLLPFHTLYEWSGAHHKSACDKMTL